MPKFNIQDVGQIPGEAPVVDKSAGQSSAIFGGAVETLGGLAKKTYEGYVVAGLEGTAGAEAQVGGLPDDEMEQNLGFTRLTQAYQSGAVTKRDAQLMAVQQKNKAIAQAPWMRDEIEQRYSQWFGGGKQKGSIYGDDKESLAMEMAIAGAKKAYLAGEFYVPPTATDQELLEKFTVHQQDVMKMSKAAAMQEQGFDGRLSALRDSTPQMVKVLSSQLTNIVKSGNDVVTKERLLQSTYNQFIGVMKTNFKMKGLTAEQAAETDKAFKEMLEPTLTALSHKDYLTGKVDADTYQATLDKFVNSSIVSNLRNKDFAKSLVLKEALGDNIVQYIMNPTSGISLSELSKITTSFGGKSTLPQDSKDFVQDQMEGGLSSYKMEDVRKSVQFNGVFKDKESLDNYYDSLPQEQLDHRVNLAVNYLDKGLLGAIFDELDKTGVDEFYLSGLELVPNSAGTGVEIKTKQDFIGDRNELSKAARALNKARNDLSGMFVILSKGGLTDSEAVRSLNERLRLETPGAPEPGLAETAGKVAAQVSVPDVLEMDVADYYNTYIGRPFSKGVRSVGKSVKDVLEDFQRGFEEDK